MLLLVLAVLASGCGRSATVDSGSPPEGSGAGVSGGPGAGPSDSGGSRGAGDANGAPATAPLPAYQADFLRPFKLAVEEPSERFTAKVPAAWEVPLGEYPEGLYWQVANVFSRDAGLDLERLKGQQVEVYRYELQGGLPGEGDQAKFSYPSNVVLLTQQERVVGAWLAFNGWGSGPSLRKRSLQDLTGFTFNDWVEQVGVFTQDGNEDLQAMEPAQVVDAFFKAINAKDMKRANACLDPAAMMSALAVNRVPKALYNPRFGENNSMTANILSGKLLSWKEYELPSGSGGFGAPAPATDPRKAHLAAEVQIRWRDGAFNSPTGQETRFIGLTKTRLGWKIDGMGTGP